MESGVNDKAGIPPRCLYDNNPSIPLTFLAAFRVAGLSAAFLSELRVLGALVNQLERFVKRRTLKIFRQGTVG